MENDITATLKKIKESPKKNPVNTVPTEDTSSSSRGSSKKSSIKRPEASKKKVSAERAKQCSYAISNNILIPESAQSRDFRMMLFSLQADVSMIVLNELFDLMEQDGSNYDLTPLFTVKEIYVKTGLPVATIRNALLKLEAFGILKLNIQQSIYNRKEKTYIAKLLPILTDHINDFFKNKFKILKK